MKNLGLTFFLVGLGLFLSLFFMSDYQLSNEDFKSIVKQEHQESLLPEIANILEKPFSNAISFANAIDHAVNTVNEQMRATQQWDQVIYDNYTASLTRAATKGIITEHPTTLFLLIFGLVIGGGVIFSLAGKNSPPGIKNNGIFFNALNNRGWIGILVGTILIAFYILLYFYDAHIMNWIILVDPLQKWINPSATSSQWFLYGFLYTIAVTVMGVRFIMKYRHSKYQIVRTISVMFFQLALAFLLPEILVRLNQPYFDFKNMWPLDYDFFDAWHINMLTSAGGIGIFMFAWGITLFMVGVPVLVYFFGKRWYCSWVCGCGGLAETAGDPFRQLSDKSLRAWKIERYLIHGVLVFAIVMTGAVLYNFISSTNTIFGLDTYTYLRKPYGFMIGSIFSGVVGTGFYPLMGNRVWCRFGCPLAAYLGFIQRFKSRFRITTNGGQCISCGNCSTYCEMGIDVRWYAQRGQNIIRSSCVGCGVCSSVCPRGVLNLENRDEEGRFVKNSFIE
ncbi:4Fe-4S binding protein [Marinoscillum sp. MHG1-6]|uniref:4Fe-4S binding protein n=1 Tax=Marinoscillum sp. MHG1-6 TaxID=2959627 RepID=UPI002157EA40|nr:4Fe-4S dicluster domain-containing protein [Marinoscillum sp. MHG1-6]